MVVIPGGASGLVFSEAAISPNYLAIRDVYGKYFLNGEWQMVSEGVFDIAGTQFVYQRNYREPEKLTAEGPTTQDIVLEVRSISAHSKCSLKTSKQMLWIFIWSYQYKIWREKTFFFSIDVFFLRIKGRLQC